MAKFAFLFQLKGETVKRFMDRPEDRSEVVRQFAESQGGRMESYYFMFGQYDGLVIVDVPDSATAAAISLAVAASGAFNHLETHELIEPRAMIDLLERSKGLQYRPPGG